jgi:hypothetical protein
VNGKRIAAERDASSSTNDYGVSAPFPIAAKHQGSALRLAFRLP